MSELVFCVVSWFSVSSDLCGLVWHSALEKYRPTLLSVGRGDCIRHVAFIMLSCLCLLSCIEPCINVCRLILLLLR